MVKKNINTERFSQVKNSRRKFLNYLINFTSLGFLGMIVYPVIKYLVPPKNSEPNPISILAGEVNELENNSWKIFRFGRKPGILIKTPNGEIKAFSAICSHLECTVQYRSDFQHIWCACHNGHYDLNGKNISGPPPRPLENYKVNIKEDKIYVSSA